jgi:hypothetical protein
VTLCINDIQHNVFSVVMLSVIMLSVIMLSVIMLSVIMLSAVAPMLCLYQCSIMISYKKSLELSKTICFNWVL